MKQMRTFDPSLQPKILYSKEGKNKFRFRNYVLK